MENNQVYRICQRIAVGVAVGIIIVIAMLFRITDKAFAEVVLNEVLPNYKINSKIEEFFVEEKDGDNIVMDSEMSEIGEIGEIEIIGLNDILYESHEKEEEVEQEKLEVVSKIDVEIDVEKLKDLDYLKQNFYIIDSTTAMSKDYFDVEKFMQADLKTERDEENPKVLIFHSHANEMFIDSDTSDINEGIVGAGAKLAEYLEDLYNITTLHIKEEFDTTDGKIDRNGAYERMEVPIQSILAENPSIEVVIDLHRDGVNEEVHLVETINGKQTAKIMFFNGISRILQSGQLNNISNLPNPNVETNLALSFNMQKTAMEKYEGLTRKIYIKPYRYSLHLMPKTLLIEAGAQTNTKEEIYNAMELLAEIINDVLF
ncbi:MAG: stage II sporulation protein P [bacterium]